MGIIQALKRKKPLTTDQKAQLFFEYLCAREAEQTRQIEKLGRLHRHYPLIKADRAELRVIRDRFLEIFER